MTNLAPASPDGTAQTAGRGPTFRPFFRLARPYRGRFAIGVLLLLLTNGLSLGIPWLMGGAVRLMEAGGDRARLATFAGGIVLLALAQAAARASSRLMILGASRRIAHDVRNVYFRQLQRLSPSYYDTHRTGDIMSRGVNDMQLIRGVYGPGVLNFLNTIIVFAGALLLLSSIDLRLTLISLSLYPLLFFGVNRLSRGVYTRSRSVQEQLAEIGNRAQESFSGIIQVKTHVQEARQIAEFSTACATLRARNVAMAAYRGAMLSLIGIGGAAGTLLVLYFGGRLVISDRIDLGEFVTFNAYLALLAWPTIAFGWIINTLQRGVGAMERIDEVLATSPEVPTPLDATLPAEHDAARCEEGGSHPTALRIDQLTFSYQGDEKPVLRSVSLDAPAGMTVGIVGPVGSGKSTIAALLARLYDVPPGSVTLSGEDLVEIDVADLRRRVVLVPQDALLFSRSLRENVAFARPAASEEEILTAIDTAGLAHDLSVFPKGIDTVVGERGFTLSGGQRQRVTIARALLARPDLLVLDDALSSVDAKTEAEILAKLAERHPDLTTVFITHRLSSLSGAHEIFVLDQGRVVENGTFQELAEANGLFSRLLRRERIEHRLETP